MDSKKLNALISIAVEASIEAGKEILKVYNSDNFETSIKKDKSPLTLADRNAHLKIMEFLEKTDLPVLSEEGRDIPFAERSQWDVFWLVDPLDGTKEFIKKNDEFTVNIALIQKDTPIGGVIYVPVLKQLFFAAQGFGAYKVENISDSSVRDIEKLVSSAKKLPKPHGEKTYKIVASRSHLSAETEEIIEKLRAEKGDIEMVSKGSSLKLCMVAEGEADYYPRLAPTSEWDTAAGHALALEAGCEVLQYESGKPVVYNKENILNPWFVVQAAMKNE